MDRRRLGRNLAPPSRLRSFALGSLLGAAGAVATVRRLHRSSRGAQAAGLAAFESAPCFLEFAGGELDASHEAAGGAAEGGHEPL